MKKKKKNKMKRLELPSPYKMRKLGSFFPP